MSFYTSLTYYRPCGPPPVVTADDLARFIIKIRDADILKNDGFMKLRVNFGDSIDQDEEEDALYQYEEISSYISIPHETECDLGLSDVTDLQEIIDALAADSRRIYRASVSLGTLVDAVLQPITRINSPENEVNYCPCDLSIGIGPVMLYDLSTDEGAFAGWIEVSISGFGYLFPWTFRDVLKRLEGIPEVQRLMEVCRSFWPVPPKTPEPRMIQLRKDFNEFWPYDDVEKPYDWYWGLQETG